MRRIMLSASLLGVLAGLGCHHVGGKSDVYQEPSNGEVAAGGGAQPYATLGPPTGGTAVPEKLAMPMDKPK